MVAVFTVSWQGTWILCWARWSCSCGWFWALASTSAYPRWIHLHRRARAPQAQPARRSRVCCGLASSSLVRFYTCSLRQLPPPPTPPPQPRRRHVIICKLLSDPLKFVRNLFFLALNNFHDCSIFISLWKCHTVRVFHVCPWVDNYFVHRV